MRNYNFFDQYYNELLSLDLYPQPSNDGHLKSMGDVISRWVIPLGISSVLDVGCGDMSAKNLLPDSVNYWGMSLGEDGRQDGALEGDFNFIDQTNVDLIFARHVLEHSPFPLITLMEFHRVSNRYLCLVLPNPEHYKYVGRNHYSVMTSHHAGWLLRRAGWLIIKFHMDREEIWFLCEKRLRIGYEGWAKVPLSNAIHEFERDKLGEYGDLNVIEYFRARDKELV